MPRSYEPNQRLEICILAGGLSSRMGRDKASLRLGSKTLLEHIRQSAQSLGVPVHVLRKDAVPGRGPLGGVYTRLTKSRADAVLFLSCDMPFISRDLLLKVTGALPKRGLAAFVVQPGFLSREERGVVERGTTEARPTVSSRRAGTFSISEWDPLTAQNPFPIESRQGASAPHGASRVGFPFVLRREALPIVEQLLDGGKRSLQHLAASLNAKLVRVSKLLQRELFNINTATDWRTAREAWAELESEH